MPFRLRTDVRKWFRDVSDRFGDAPNFDMYYFCFITGLASNRLREVKDADTTELTDSFPGEYASKGKLLMAVFIRRELRREGVRLTDREALNIAIAQLVDTNSPSRLSSMGLKIMNQYAEGGFEVLSTEWFHEPPRHLETFLALFHRHLQQTLKDRSSI